MYIVLSPIAKPPGLIQLICPLSSEECGPSETQIRGHLTTNPPSTCRLGRRNGGYSLLALPNLSCCSDPMYILPHEAKQIARYVVSTEVNCPYCPFQTFLSEESSTEYSTAGCQNISQGENKQTTPCCWSKASGPRRALKIIQSNVPFYG